MLTKLHRHYKQNIRCHITSDILFPLSEQKYLAAHIPNAMFAQIGSVYGHDGFLLEFEAIEKEITQFIKNNSALNKTVQPVHSQ